MIMHCTAFSMCLCGFGVGLQGICHVIWGNAKPCGFYKECLRLQELLGYGRNFMVAWGLTTDGKAVECAVDWVSLYGSSGNVEAAVRKVYMVDMQV